jgi:hypothetical protein
MRGRFGSAGFNLSGGLTSRYGMGMSSCTRWIFPAAHSLPAVFLLLLVPGRAAALDSAVVVRINGAPTVERAGKSAALRPADSVSVGDVIVTDAAAKVKLLLADDSVLAIGPKSRVAIDQFVLATDSRRVKLRVIAGRFKIAIAKFFGVTSDYEVRTPMAVAGVRGTVLWGDTDLDTICALDGHIEVRATTGSSSPAQLTAGDCVSQMAAGKTVPLKPSTAELAAYLKEVTLE